MEITNVWALAAFFGTSAFAATIKAVEYRRELKLADEEISCLRKELDFLKEKHQESISNLDNLKSAQKPKSRPPSQASGLNYNIFSD